jgi:hypothetical protein
MIRHVQLLIVALLGLLAPIWWTWSVSQLHYQLYLLSGSPDRPSQLFAWSAILAIPFALGLMVGAIIYVSMRQSPIRSWSVFWTFLLVGSVIFSLFFDAPKAIARLFISPGTWSFAFGTAAIPLLLRHYAKKN